VIGSGTVRGRSSKRATVAMTVALPASGSVGVSASGALTTTTCHAAALTATFGRSSGAAGTTYDTLKIINHSSASCTLSGVPATQLGNRGGSGPIPVFRPVGPAATTLTIAGRGRVVVLRPGAVASVTLGISMAGNCVPTQCRSAYARMVRVVFHRGVVSTTLYFSLQRTAVCTQRASTSISGVVLGTHFP